MLMNLRAFAARDTGMTDSEVEMSRMSALRFGRPGGESTNDGDASAPASRLVWAREKLMGKGHYYQARMTSTDTSTDSRMGTGSGTTSTGLTSATTATTSTDTSFLPIQTVSFALPESERETHDKIVEVVGIV